MTVPGAARPLVGADWSAAPGRDLSHRDATGGCRGGWVTTPLSCWFRRPMRNADAADVCTELDGTCAGRHLSSSFVDAMCGIPHPPMTASRPTIRYERTAVKRVRLPDQARVHGGRPARDLDERLGEPGEYPYTRGVYPTMYTTRPWTMRQYAGFGTAAESNARYHQLLARRHDGPVGRLRPAHPDGVRLRRPDRARRGRQGRRGDRLDRRHAAAVRRHPAGQGLHVDDDQRARLACCCCSTSSSPRSRACPAPRSTARSRTTSSRSTSPAGRTSSRRSRRCGWSPTRSPTAATEIPKWNTISISGYHMAEAGATPVQEIAFTLANGIEYVRAALDAGLAVDDFAPAAVVLLRRPHHAAGGGREVPRRPADLGPDHARRVRRQGPEVDDAALPHPDRRRAAHRPAARGQPGPGRGPGARRGARRHPVAAHQLLRRGDRAAHREGGPAGAAHPAGARVRDRPDRHRGPVRRLVRGRGDDRRGRGGGDRADGAGRSSYGSAVDAIEAGLPEARDRDRRRTGSRRRSTPASGWWSGVNRFTLDEEEPYEPLRVDPAIEAAQAARLAKLRAERDAGAVERGAGRAARRPPRARRTCCYPMREALRARATVGEVCDTLREVWGVYRPSDRF